MNSSRKEFQNLGTYSHPLLWALNLRIVFVPVAEC